LNAQDFSLSDPLSSPLEQRLTQYDVPQKFTILSTYELPFGRGKSYGKSLHPILNALAGNWQLNGNLTLQRGFPMDFPNALPVAARSAKLSKSQRNMFQWFDTSLWKDPATSQVCAGASPLHATQLRDALSGCALFRLEEPESIRFQGLSYSRAGALERPAGGVQRD
jgi:hypothetical protein